MTSNLLEIRLGKAAQKNGFNSAVKQFGQQMVTDHTTLQSQLGNVATRNRLPLRSVIDPAQEQEARRVESLSGAEFDREYMTTMLNEHQRAVELFQNEQSSGQSAELRQLAANALPTIQQHLTLAQQVGGQVGAAGVIASQNPTGQTGPITHQPVGTPESTQTGPITREQVRTQTGRTGGQNVSADMEFIRDVTAASVMEVRLGERARNRASNSQVKRFADQMVSYFSRLQDEWTRAASTSGKSFEPGMGPLHKEKVDRVEHASKRDFDRIYMTTVIQNLNALLPYFQNEGRSANSAAVRNLVERQLPNLRENLATARRIGAEVNADLSGRDRDVSSKNERRNEQ